MWKLKIGEGNDPYLFTTNNFVGRQIWEFDPDAGTPEERQEVEEARQHYRNSRKEGDHPCGDLFMRMQVSLNHKNMINKSFCLLFVRYFVVKKHLVSGCRLVIFEDLENQLRSKS